MDQANAPSIAKSSAAYGHACANCVKAKCKCIPRGNGSSCERCHRLVKDCQPATFIRRRGPRKSTPRKSQLEDKLDNLCSLLQAQSAPTHPLPSRPGTQIQHENPDGTLPTPVESETYSSHASPFWDDVSSQSADQILAIFHDRFLKFFPFVHIPPDMPGVQLQQNRPFMFKSIRVACESDPARQAELGAQVREEITRRVVANAERSLDLLLSLLVCMIWQFYFTKARPCLGMFSNVARTLVADLRLDDKPSTMVMACPKMPSFQNEPDCGAKCTDEERRALVACFALSAFVCLSLKYDSMRWSPQLERSCQRLERNLGIAGDQVLVAMARISRVSTEAAGMIQRLSVDSDYAAQALLQIKTLRGMLDQVKNNLTPEQLQHTGVLGYLYSTEVLIHEGALIPPASSLRTQPTLDLQRAEYLAACVQACKATLDNFLAVGFVHMNMPTILSFSHAAQILYKLSIIDCPSWDRSLVRATADVLWYFERAAARLEEANQELQRASGSTNSVFHKAGEAMTDTMAVWKEGLDAVAAADLNSQQIGVATDPTVAGFDPMDTSWLSFPDDVWFGSAFAPS